jgi:hydrogenase maturation protease
MPEKGTEEIKEDGGLRASLWSPPTRPAPSGQPGSDNPPILVVGLGNPILGDDGVGWLVAERVRMALEGGAFRDQAIEIDSLALGGLSLMERLIGYRQVIIIDALTTHQQPIGSLYRVPLHHLPDMSAGHTTAVHDTSLQTALIMGRAMGARLPEQIVVVGVEAEKVYDFTETLTPEVEAAIPGATQAVLEILVEWTRTDPGA